MENQNDLPLMEVEELDFHELPCKEAWEFLLINYDPYSEE